MNSRSIWSTKAATIVFVTAFLFVGKNFTQRYTKKVSINKI